MRVDLARVPVRPLIGSAGRHGGSDQVWGEEVA